MEEPLTLTQRINRANYLIDYVNVALNDPIKRDAFVNKSNQNYRQATVDAIFFTLSRLKQEILEEREEAETSENERIALDALMIKINNMLPTFEPIASSAKTEGGARKRYKRKGTRRMRKGSRRKRKKGT